MKGDGAGNVRSHREYDGDGVVAPSDWETKGTLLAGDKLKPILRSLFMPIVGVSNTSRKFLNARHFGDSYELLNSVSMIG